MNWRVYVTLIAVAGIAGVGCEDDKPAPPPPPPPHKDPTPPKPTTQQILESPRKSLSMAIIPFRIDAPELWQVQVHENKDLPSITMVEGPIVNDEVRIQVGSRPPLSAERVKILRELAAKENEQLKKVGGYSTVTERNDLILIERRKMPTPATMPTEFDAWIDWQMTLLVPSGISYDQYEIQFIGLTLETFKANESLLTDVLKTISYDSTAPGGPPPKLR